MTSSSSSSSSYKDCSIEICSIYCPQRCFLFHPPPPSFDLDDDYDSGGPDFSPIIIALIGILASAFILICYYTIISRFCGRHRSSSDQLNEMNNQDWQEAGSDTGGLDEALMKSITICCKYQKGVNLVEGTECSVCLSEFEDDESLRLLPKCNHAFHLPCIDTWLKSHSSCPLCRADIAAPPDHHVSSALEYQHRRRNDVILVIEDHQVVVSLVGEEQELELENAPKMPDDARRLYC